MTLALLLAGCGSSRTPAVSAPEGQRLYATYCVHCHGVDAANDRGGAMPQMRLIDAAAFSDAQWTTIVLDGRGSMPAFRGRLRPGDVAAIARFIREQRRESRK